MEALFWTTIINEMTLELAVSMHHSMIKLTTLMVSIHLPRFVQKNWPILRHIVANFVSLC